MDIFYNTDIYNIPEATKGNRISTSDIEKSIITILLKKGDYGDESLIFLENIMKAIGLDLYSECILREFKGNILIDFSKIKQSDNSKYLMGFGLKPSQFKTQAIIYPGKWNHFDDLSLLLNNSLDKIKNDIKLKKTLWEELKKVFNDK